jgi:hypothetical protein
MAATQLNRLNHRHEGLLNWLILNPSKSQNDCARELGYTPAWVSQVINSDMFQALYKERCAECGILAVHTITAQLAGATSIALEKTIEKLQNGPSERFLGEALRTCLTSMGYTSNGGQAPAGNTVVNVMVQSQALTEARDRAAAYKAGTTQAKLELVPPIVQSPADDLDALMELPTA